MKKYFILFFWECTFGNELWSHGIDGMEDGRPLIVAHKGASGVLPAHSVEAYQLAIDSGNHWELKKSSMDRWSPWKIFDGLISGAWTPEKMKNTEMVAVAKFFWIAGHENNADTLVYRAWSNIQVGWSSWILRTSQRN